MIRSFIWVGILATFLTPPLQAQVSSDSVAKSRETAIIFRFVPGKLMFYSPFQENEKSIKELGELMNEHKDEIIRGNAFISIQGFCGSFPSEKENLIAAKNRTNQVKSYFITHGWMKEEYYRTRNHVWGYDHNHDVVTYIRLIYAEGYIPPSIKEQQESERRAREAAEVRERVRLDSLACSGREAAIREAAVSDSLAWEQDVRESAETPPVEYEYRFTPWSVKTNLVYDAVLMPSLEIEYRISRHWSVNLEGNMAWWHDDPRHQYYQLATITPEARYWFKYQGCRKGHYIGLFAGGGWYDLENGGRGYKGEGGFAGISYGYMFPVGRYFSFEAGVGLGYLNTKYEEYLPLDGEYVYQQTSRLSYVGPLKLKFAWVWHIGRWSEKKDTMFVKSD